MTETYISRDPPAVNPHLPRQGGLDAAFLGLDLEEAAALLRMLMVQCEHGALPYEGRALLAVLGWRLKTPIYRLVRVRDALIVKGKLHYQGGALYVTHANRLLSALGG